MANPSSFKDPLSFGAEDVGYVPADLEDLTAALESSIALHPPGTRRDSSEDYEASSEIPGGTSSMANFINSAEPVSMDGYASYGQLVRPPPAYEQTSVYHTVSLQSSPAADPLASPSTTGPPQAAAPAAAAELQPGQMVITVTDPQKREQAGMLGMKSTYVAYLVTTKTGQAGGGKKETAVRRRFNDFVSLADMVKIRYRGYFVPARPEKNVVEGSRPTEAFVEERRAALERYLNKLARHPAIKNSEALEMFLTAETELASHHQWVTMLPPSATVLETTTRFSMQLLGRESSVVDPVSAAQATNKGGDFMRALKEQAQSMRAVAYDGEEARLRVVRDGMEGMRDALVAATRSAEQMVRKLDRQGSVLGDLGLALFAMAKLEEGAGGALAVATGTLRHSTSMVSDTKRMGTGLVRLTRQSKRVVSYTALHLSQLHEYMGAMPGVLKGMGAREKQLLTAETLEVDMEQRKKLLAEAEAGGGNKLGSKRVNDLKFEISQLELSITAAKNEYEKIKTANVQELDRFKAERQQDWMRMLCNLAVVQTEASERSAKVWLQLASELGAPNEQVADIMASVTAAAPAPISSTSTLI